MDSITFKNFRQFKDETVFELNNINILVGKNNSGKSTLTKGLRLYLFNMKNLEFAFSGCRGESPWIAPMPLTKYLSATEHKERQVVDTMHLRT